MTQMPHHLSSALLGLRGAGGGPLSSPPRGVCRHTHSDDARAVSAAPVVARRPGGQPRPIRHEGVDYPSLSALAAAYGLCPATVSNALRRGRLHTLGQGNMRHASPVKAQAARRQPVAAHGWHWPSQVVAARAIGVHPSTVTYALRTGSFAALVLRRLGVRHD